MPVKPPSGRAAVRRSGSTTPMKPPPWFCLVMAETLARLQDHCRRRPVVASSPRLLRLCPTPAPMDRLSPRSPSGSPGVYRKPPTWRSRVVVNGKEIGDRQRPWPRSASICCPCPPTCSRRTKTWSNSKCAAAAATPTPPPCSDSRRTMKATPDHVVPSMESVRQWHAQVEYRGKPIDATSSSAGQAPRKRPAPASRRQHSSGATIPADGRHYALEIALPPGTRFDPKHPRRGSQLGSPARR